MSALKTLTSKTSKAVFLFPNLPLFPVQRPLCGSRENHSLLGALGFFLQV